MAHGHSFLLMQMGHVIQCALIVLCVGLLILGFEAFHEYFKGNQGLFWAGVLAMGFGTVGILLEIITGADTLRHEKDFAGWYAGAGEHARRLGEVGLSRLPSRARNGRPGRFTASYR